MDDRDDCCPLIGTASDVQRGGGAVKAAYQEVVEQLVKVFEDHLNEPQARERALALVALCVGGMVLARNIGDPDLADDVRRAAHSEVKRCLFARPVLGANPKKFAQTDFSESDRWRFDPDADCRLLLRHAV